MPALSSVTLAVSATSLPMGTVRPLLGVRMATWGGMSALTVARTPTRCSCPATSTACTSSWTTFPTDAGGIQVNLKSAVPSGAPPGVPPVRTVLATVFPSASSAALTPNASPSSPIFPEISSGTPTVASTSVLVGLSTMITGAWSAPMITSSVSAWTTFPAASTASARMEALVPARSARGMYESSQAGMTCWTAWPFTAVVIVTIRGALHEPTGTSSTLKRTTS